MNAPLARLLLCAISTLGAAACLEAQASPSSELALAARSSEAADAAAPTDEPPSPPAPRCTLDASCRPVRTFAFQLEACCSETVACGLDMAGFADQGLDPETAAQVFPKGFSRANGCLRPRDMFIAVPGAEAQRVAVTGRPDILIAPECSTYNVFSFPLPGCCLPSGHCGMSSHLSLSNLVPFLAPGNEMETPQCLTGAEFNRQLRGSPIERIGDAPDITGRCDYAALDARLPPAEPAPRED